jgi:hypothetical protein
LRVDRGEELHHRHAVPLAQMKRLLELEHELPRVDRQLALIW